MNIDKTLKVLDKLLSNGKFKGEELQAISKARDAISIQLAVKTNQTAYPGYGVVRCESCIRFFFERDCTPVKDVLERVQPGELFPACECPICHALCHYALLADVGKDKQDRYVIAEQWEHLKADNSPWIIRWVYDRWNSELVTVEEAGVISAYWLRTNAEQMIDVENHIVNANPEVLKKPSDWGLCESNNLPQWAKLIPLNGYHY